MNNKLINNETNQILYFDWKKEEKKFNFLRFLFGAESAYPQPDPDQNDTDPQHCFEGNFDVTI